MQETTGADSSLAARVGAKEFFPSPPGLSAVAPLAKPDLPAADGNGFNKSPSSLGLSAAAVNAPVFIPGSSSTRPAAVDAKPFVPGSAVLQGKQPATTKPAKSASPAKASSTLKGNSQRQQRGEGSTGFSSALAQQQQQQQAQSSGAGASPDVALPEGDDILGMTAVVPGEGPTMAAQAAEMFRALNPFPSAGRGRGVSQQPYLAQKSPRPAGGRGALDAPGAGPPAGGRGGGGGQGGGAGRGRGRVRRSGPSSQRPSAGYVVGQGRMLKAGFFTSESLRQELQQRAYLTQAQVNPETEGDYGLPEVIQQYAGLYPLEDTLAAGERLSQAHGVQTQVIKAISCVDGQAYALRRVDPRQVIPTAELLATAEECVERWSSLSNHPNMAGLREAFIANEVGSTPALFLAYDYHPGSLTLEQAHIQPSQTAQGLMRNPATEEQLWSYLIQLASVLRSAHSAGLAVRPPALAPSKVLLTSHGRVRLGCVGLAEVLASEGGGGLPPPGGREAAALQRQDLTALGNLLLLLACAGRSVAPTLDYVTAHFSRELCHVVAGLLAASEGTGFASWRSLVAALGDRVFDELDGSNVYSDSLMGELQKESENGRLLRLLTKLDAVTERAELDGDTQWSETGDRYVAKLFRDFVFHQVDEEGAPVLDHGLMVEALNKVDAGVPEKVLLLSRDEISMLVVSYADVKRCIQNSYAELRARSSSSLQRSKSKAELRYAEKAGGNHGGYY